LSGHEVETAYERGWETLKNGALLDAAEEAGFEVLLTTDQNLPYQQNLPGRALRLVILVAHSNRVAELSSLVPAALEALPQMAPGEVRRIEEPSK
jgi:hypothetical protein